MDALPPDVIDSLVDSAPFASGLLREETRVALKGRVAWMGDRASGIVFSPQFKSQLPVG